jgi:enoyl-CoA hydratase
VTGPTVLVERDGGIGSLRINNPRLRNALSRPVLDELKQALEGLARDSTMRVLIIGSALDGIFVSGGNINELAGLEGTQSGLQFALDVQAVFDLVEQFPWPVIAAINGRALGAGAELASACDLRIAADTVHIAFPHVRLGITPGLGGGQRLVRLVGRAHAKRIILSGEPLTATEAWQIGWVDRLAPQEQLWKVTEELARDLACKPRCAMQLAKKALNSSSQAGFAAGCAQEALRFGLACSMAWGTD